MKEIVERLQEKRQIERAKELVEHAGYKVSKMDESAQMIIKPMSGINASGFDIEIKDGDETLFSKNYRWGWDASYSRENAEYSRKQHEKAEKYNWENKHRYQYAPYITDIVDELCLQYNINKEDILFSNGKNVFTGGNVSDKEVEKFKNDYFNESTEVSESKIIARAASEHKEGYDLVDSYYGYVTIEHPTLGEFTVSVGIDGDVRTDGKPWQFLKEEPLTSEQSDFIKAHEEEIGNLMKSGDNSIEISESKITEATDKFKSGDRVLVLLPDTLDKQLDGVIDHRASTQEIRDAGWDNGANDDSEFYIVTVQWRGQDAKVTSPVEGIQLLEEGYEIMESCKPRRRK